MVQNGGTVTRGKLAMSEIHVPMHNQWGVRITLIKRNVYCFDFDVLSKSFLFPISLLINIGKEINIHSGIP